MTTETDGDQPVGGAFIDQSTLQAACADIDRFSQIAKDDFEVRLDHALKLLAEANQASQILESGRRYTTVAKRVEVFRRAFGPLAMIQTDIEHCDDDVVRAHAAIGFLRADRILIVAEGRSEEFRDAHDVNRTSALENAETSAIGRALAALGLHGGEFASADEIASALAQVDQFEAREATRHVQPEELAAAITVINACKTLDELAQAYMPLNPALKVAVDAMHQAKFKSISAQPSGTEPEKAGSQPPPSVPPSALRRRRAPSSGDA